jgi:uncharacterized protein YhbP (UPF0306 family)
MSAAADLVEEYVSAGMLMQVATLDADGAPAVCSVWYAAAFRPDLLRFISRPERRHSANIRDRARVAGAVVAGPLDGLGQAVRGVSFTGQACELPRAGVDGALAGFLGRWPAAAPLISPAGLRDGTTRPRLYEARVAEWVLFDEVNFPGEPRQVVPGRLS